MTLPEENWLDVIMELRGYGLTYKSIAHHSRISVNVLYHIIRGETQELSKADGLSLKELCEKFRKAFSLPSV